MRVEVIQNIANAYMASFFEHDPRYVVVNARTVEVRDGALVITDSYNTAHGFPLRNVAHWLVQQ